MRPGRWSGRDVEKFFENKWVLVSGFDPLETLVEGEISFRRNLKVGGETLGVCPLVTFSLANRNSYGLIKS